MDRILRIELLVVGSANELCSEGAIRFVEHTRGDTLSAICELVHEQQVISFRVCGFYERAWPVDVRTDLVVLLEQLPAVLDNLSRGASGEIDFYEQGIGRCIRIEPSRAPEVLLLSCRSSLASDPETRAQPMQRATLLSMLAAVYETFLQTALSICGGHVANADFLEWCRSCEASITSNGSAT